MGKINFFDERIKIGDERIENLKIGCVFSGNVFSK